MWLTWLDQFKGCITERSLNGEFLFGLEVVGEMNVFEGIFVWVVLTLDCFLFLFELRNCWKMVLVTGQCLTLEPNDPLVSQLKKFRCELHFQLLLLFFFQLKFRMFQIDHILRFDSSSVYSSTIRTIDNVNCAGLRSHVYTDNFRQINWRQSWRFAQNLQDILSVVI